MRDRQQGIGRMYMDFGHCMRIKEPSETEMKQLF